MTILATAPCGYEPNAERRDRLRAEGCQRRRPRPIDLVNQPSVAIACSTVPPAMYPAASPEKLAKQSSQRVLVAVFLPGPGKRLRH
ncbi:hypothetical protein GCM10027426_05650 [Microbacterium lacusdiani]